MLKLPAAFVIHNGRLSHFSFNFEFKTFVFLGFLLVCFFVGLLLGFFNGLVLNIFQYVDIKFN